VFGVNPNLVMFDDGQSPNAFASPQITLYGFTGTVYFGIGLVRNQLWSMDKGEAAVAGIMAHEFSHILQMKMGSTLTGKYRELHADFMAGYYLHAKSYVARADIKPFAQSLFETGDYNFRSPVHHGTPEERVSAMLAGYNTELPLVQAFHAGERYMSVDQAGPAVGIESRDSNQSERADAEGFSIGNARNEGVSDSRGGGGFCSDLQLFVNAAKSHFKSLRGRPGELDDTFSSTRTLSGFRDCDIVLNGDEISCRTSGSAEIDDVAHTTRDCLGPGWSMSKETTSAGTRYSFKSGSGEVRVRTSTRGKVGLAVMAPD